jgi:cytochrome c biogenesis protein CcmG/thiol:disulfide interchange protein DsbE
VRSWKFWTMMAVCAGLLGLLGFGLTRNAQFLPSAIIGQKAHPFTLETLDGDSLRLDDLKGKIVILNFWASWCIPCREEHPVLEMAAARYAGQDVQLVGVVYQDSRENARQFLAQNGGSWPSVLDPGGRVSIAYGVYGVPETFFLDRTGRIVKKHVAPMTWDLLSSEVDSLLAAPAPEAESGAP